jgi:hypothetical protein
MKLCHVLTLAAIGAGIASSPSMASVIVAQQAGPAPTYATTLNFDEPGGPTGANVPNNSWNNAPWNLQSFMSGDQFANFVGNNSGFTNQGTNSYAGPYGVFVKFSQDVTSMSFQSWDDSGPASPFGGGMAVYLLNNGDEFNPVFADVYTPAYGGLGNSWFNITTSGGTVFDEIRILGNGFFPTTYVDNLSWTSVPEPASLSFLMIGCAGLIIRRSK